MDLKTDTLLSTMWDLYFFLRFDSKDKITPAEFEKLIKQEFSRIFGMSIEAMPIIKDPVIDLFSYGKYIEEYYVCEEKKQFILKYQNSVVF